MKIVVSYLSSLYDKKTSVSLIDKTTAYGIHADLMDGTYVGEENFSVTELKDLFENVTKPIDVHMMITNPRRYLDDIILLKPECVYIHPNACPNVYEIFNILKENNIKLGIAINPDENVYAYENYLNEIDRVLLMSVYPGKGGQEFIPSTLEKIKKLESLKETYNFEIFIDGGVNDEVIKIIKNVDGVVSGSFICKNEDFEKGLIRLRNSLK